MPDLSLPDVRLRDRLPEGLRDMSIEDIQRAVPDVRVPHLDLSKIELGREAQRAARRADRAARQAQRSVGRAVVGALPQRPGPNPVPIAILAMLGGLVVGWLLASNPATGPRVRAWLDSIRTRVESMRGNGIEETEDDDWETEPRAYPESLRAPIASEPYTGTLPESETGVSVGPGHLPEGMGTDDPERVGAAEGTVQSER